METLQCVNTQPHHSHNWQQRRHPEAARGGGGNPLLNYHCEGIAEGGRFKAIWTDAATQLHYFDLAHDGGYCPDCLRIGTQLDGTPTPKYYLDGDPIVPLHILCDPLAHTTRMIIGLMTLEIWGYQQKAPDLREYPIGVRDLVMRVLAHEAQEDIP